MNNKLRTYVNIDLDAISHNIREVKKLLADDVKVMAVIKADGYGHGAVRIARHIADDVEAFGVASLDEAVELRNAGVTAPILILGYTMHAQYPDVIAYGIEQTVFSMQDAEALNACAAERNQRVSVHIAVDTGMGRIGFLPTQESADEIRQIAELSNTDIVGCFTHFATADERDQTYAMSQQRCFEAFMRLLRKVGVEIPVKHLCNSAAIMDPAYCGAQMVRAGIVLYGLYPSAEVNRECLSLKPALEWKAHVVHIKTLNAGYGISYGRTYVTEHDNTRVATVNVGYGDGYPRGLSNKGRVLVHGKAYPIIGRVCMDQFMVDITDSAEGEIRIEDEVTLIGRDGDLCIPAEELAELTGTIHYEIICGIHKRVPRVYQSGS